jgi:hypothetical protein
MLHREAMNTPKCLTQFMLATLFTHELDAMTQSEWRLLYVLRTLSDAQGSMWFVAIHVPLFWALIALTHVGQDGVQRASRAALAAFCVLHALLHLRLRDDPLSTFSSLLSWGLILGPAVLGVAYLSLMAYSRRTPH